MILFLDFDGVLHPDAAYLQKGRPVLHGEGTLFMWAPPLIEALAPHSHVKIVLSTSWVRVRGFSRARSALPEALAKRVIGATWHSSMLRSDELGNPLPVTRYQQIARYISRAQVTQWTAIDDDGEGWVESHRDRLILTDPNKGIADPAALEQLRRALKFSLSDSA